MSLDDGEQVIEIVRHAARQLPNRLHLLRLPQLGFEESASGDIGGGADPATDPVSLVPDGVSAMMNPTNSVVRPDDPVDFVVTVGFISCLDCSKDAFPVV